MSVMDAWISVAGDAYKAVKKFASLCSFLFPSVISLETPLFLNDPINFP